MKAPRAMALMIAAALASAPALAADAPVAPAAVTDAPVADAPPKSAAEIKAHNSKLASTDAQYIRCRKINATGSLVKKTRVCQSNAQWRRTVEGGNRTARDTVEHNARAWSNGN